MSICEICHKEYKPISGRTLTSRYCSKECWSQRNPPVTKECPYCGSAFTTYDRDAIFCSRRCATKSRTGEKAGAWKDGKSLERDRARLGTQLKEWRHAVYVRDNYTCQQCGAKGKLHAHHIQPWADYPELRFEIDNGITVCEICHGKIHGKDFSNRRKKTCQGCGATTDGRSQFCRSCASKRQHERAGHKQPRICPQCKATFIPRRADRMYCSPKCGRASVTKLVTVQCTQCGKNFLKNFSMVQNTCTNHFFCSEHCQHAYQDKRVLVMCPICGKEFKVGAYRLRNGKRVTCSRACKGKHASLLSAQAKRA